MKPHRLTLTNSLVVGYGLHKRMDVFSPREATQDELESFHDADYVDFLSRSVCLAPLDWATRRTLTLCLGTLLQGHPFSAPVPSSSVPAVQLRRRLSCFHGPIRFLPAVRRCFARSSSQALTRQH